jgi:hypothetical protein
MIGCRAAGKFAMLMDIPEIEKGSRAPRAFDRRKRFFFEKKNQKTFTTLYLP